MNHRRIAILLAGLLVTLSAHAVRNAAVRIKVLDSETHSFSVNDNGVPKNCDLSNYDAYCHSSKTTEVINTLLVQVGDEPPFHISCTIDTKWSRCIPLAQGESFDARKQKRGLTVYYQDDKGKVRKQLYTYVGGEPKSIPAGPAASAASPATSAAPVAASAGVSAQASPAARGSSAPRESVKCSFSSTPAGADITLDGQYVGSTPSEVSLTTGKHAVVISMPGFAPWKRELAVSPGSALTVNAVLEKTQ